MPFFSSSGFRKRRESLAKPPDVVRITVLGDGQTGKTSLVRQFLEFKFPQKYRPTVDDIITVNYKTEEVDGAKNYEMEIVDATGSYEFPAMRRLYIDSSDAFIVVMSVDQPQSVEEARVILHAIRNRRSSSLGNPHGSLTSQLSAVRLAGKNSDSSPRVVFVLNKMDLPDDKKLVNVEKVQNDREFGFENIVLTSAKENWNVDEAFSRLMAPSQKQHDEQVEKSLEAALHYRRVTAPHIDLTGGSDSFLLALKNSITPASRHSAEYTPIAP